MKLSQRFRLNQPRPARPLPIIRYLCLSQTTCTAFLFRVDFKNKINANPNRIDIKPPLDAERNRTAGRQPHLGREVLVGDAAVGLENRQDSLVDRVGFFLTHCDSPVV